ncbi:MAG: hypothetical protein ACT4PE_02430 [Candidatus Eiseniibacteriota bacterium]
MPRVLLALFALFPATPARAVPALEEHPPRALVETPSEVVAGETFRVAVLISDRWGPEGPEAASAGVTRAVTVEISVGDPAAELPAHVRVPTESRGRALFEAKLPTPGLWRIAASGEGFVAGESAPIRVLESKPSERVYWGDVHAHLGTPGGGHSGVVQPSDYERIAREALEFARDVALLDFCAPTPHIQEAGGLARPTPTGTVWDAFVRAVEAANEPGRFVTFPGFEWQGEEGDHCVLLPAAGPLAAPFSFARLADSALARGALLTAHAVFLPSRFEPRHAALAGVEVTRDSQDLHSFGLGALAQGLAPAFLGASDNHGGAIGSTSLTGLRAPSLSREAVFRAVRERRTWATNGERIVLDFGVDVAGDVPTVQVRGVGTAPIELIEVYRGAKVVAQARGFAESPEFAFTWEDEDLLRLESLAASLVYHAKVVQTSSNRYDPSRRDIAVASPVEVRLEPRHFDGAHARAGGTPGRAVGEALCGVRDAWDALRPAPDRALRSDPPEGVPFEGFAPGAVAALRDATRDIERLAAEDPALVHLARGVAALPAIAEAVGAMSAAVAAGDLAGAYAAAARASTASRGADSTQVAGAWFAARLAADLPAKALAATAGLAGGPPVPAVRGDTAAVTRLLLPVDPRIAERARPWTDAAWRLAAEQSERWGYTSAATLPDEPALTVRVVAEGSPGEAKLVGGNPRELWTVPLDSTSRGWTATLPQSRVPEPGGGPLSLEFSRPARVGAVFLEPPGPGAFPPLGSLESVRVERSGSAAALVLEASTDSVEVLVSAESDGRALWHGRVGPGRRSVVLPLDALGEDDRVVARWGFAGWRHAAGTVIPGHDAARADGFGALGDGRAVLALDRELVVVDPRGGEAKRFAYPAEKQHRPGRELCVVPLERRTLIRGAAGPSGGWAALLDPDSGEWHEAPRGPEAGTVAAHPSGGYAWLDGERLRRRLADGSQVAGAALAVSGRLLGFEPSGRAVVRSGTGEALRVDPGTAAAARVEGPALAMEPGGAVLVYAGLGARHAELAREVRLLRVLPDGSTSGPFALAVKASPVLDPPVRVAAVADGTLLVLGGTCWWRREPDHDWWGASVERWEPVWVGVLRGGH